MVSKTPHDHCRGHGFNPWSEIKIPHAPRCGQKKRKLCGVGRRVQREGTYVYLWLIHADVWQKPTQYCKAILLQLKRNKFKKKKESMVWRQMPGFIPSSISYCKFLGKLLIPFSYL